MRRFSRHLSTRAPAPKRRRTFQRWFGLSAVAVIGGAVLVAPNANAASTSVVTATFPAVTSVGQTGQIVVTLTNPTGVAAAVTSLSVVASCAVAPTVGAALPACGTSDPGVFSLAAAPQPVGACAAGGAPVIGAEAAGVFPVTVALTVPANSNCTYTLNQTTVKAPATDVDGATFGSQTLTAIGVTDGVGSSSAAGNPATVTVNKVNPSSITTVPSAGGNLGTSVKVTATVNGRVNSTALGTLTFRLFSDNTCATLVNTSAPVVQPAANGPVDSPLFEPLAVGTYFWRVFYSGDANNNAFNSVCGQAGSTVTIGTPDEDPDEDENANPLTCNGKPATTGGSNVNGGSGGQVIVGTAGNDVLNGGSGNDTICGFGGNDVITGGSGDDFIDGGAGADTIDGGSGNDQVIVGAGDTVS